MSNTTAMNEELEGIAIIGMNGRFPQAQDIESFWQNLRDGVECISFFTDEELLAAGVAPEILANPNYVKAKGILADIDLFDAGFFGYTPREAELIDPQQRLFLECAWEVLEVAGYNPDIYPGKIGVYAGTGCNSYLLFNIASHPQFIDAENQYKTLIANDKDFLTTRVSYKLNLKGPSVDVQTACSTSLVAVNLACQSLLTYQCDMALAGGVTITMPQKSGYLYQEGGIFSPDGHCRAFDAQAQGTVIGNGVGIVLLKRLEDAIADRDQIYAVIKATAMNNDGAAKVGYTAPSIQGQMEAIAEAMELAQVHPETIGYIETHGTGTALGDPIEIKALTKAFSPYTNQQQFCAIGSVKTNVGHLDAAAGVTGLIKATLALKHQQIPPSLHFESANSQINFAESPFYVNSQLSEWKTTNHPRRAAVSALGIGGTNVHLILEEAQSLVKNSTDERPWKLLLISAKTRTALDQATKNLAGYLQQHPEINLADVAYTLQVGRRSFNHRRLVVVREHQEAIKALENWQQQALRQVTQQSDRAIVFMFPGQGAQTVNMGRELYENELIFRHWVDRCSEMLIPDLGLDLRSLLYPAESEIEFAREILQETFITQPVLFVIEYALAQLWMSWGITPQAMIGHSLGEYVAACLAGVFSLEDGLKLVALRGKLMQELPKGSMLAVGCAEAEILEFLKSPDLKNQSLSIAAVNSFNSCVISGNPEAIKIARNFLENHEIHTRILKTSHGFHSEMMEPILAPFIEVLESISLQAPQIPFISNLTGTWIKPEAATNPNYWAQHLRQPVRFAAGISELFSSSDRIFLEVGPGRTLSTLATHMEPPQNSVILSSLPHAKDEQSDLGFLYKTLGQLWLAGVVINWHQFYGEELRDRVPLPTYPFQRQRYWIEPNQVLPFPENRANQRSGNECLEVSLETVTQSRYVRPNVSTKYLAPRNETEQILAEIWQELLGIETVGIHDNYFELGGDSILGLQVSAKINQAGFRVTPKQLFEFSTVAELAAIAAQTQSIKAEQGLVTGNVALTPIQHWFFEQNFAEAHHWNQAILIELAEEIAPEILRQAIQHLLIHHDGLRLQFEKAATGWKQKIMDLPETIPFSRIDLSGLSPAAQQRFFDTAAKEFQANLNLTTGSLIQVALFEFGSHQPSQLLIVIHHLAVDILSWRILITDLQTTYQQIRQGKAVQLPRKTTSFKQWSEKLQELSQSLEMRSQVREIWQAMMEKKPPALPRDRHGKNLVASIQTLSTALSEAETQTLLQEVTATYRVPIETILLSAIAQAFTHWTTSPLLVDLEGSGREVAVEGVDLSRTVGWFTTIAPVLLDVGANPNPITALTKVKAQLQKIPDEGLGYGLCRYCSDRSLDLSGLNAEVSFLYLGQIDRTLPASPLFARSQAFNSHTRSSQSKRPYLIEIQALITENQLRIDWIYSDQIHQRETVEALGQKCAQVLRSLMVTPEITVVETFQESDFTEFQWSQWNQDDLDKILSAVSQSQGS